MKRLLAAGSGSIYQLGKAFRCEERGPLHNPEFSLLEWYRIGFDHYQLMDEVDALLQNLLGTPPSEKITYAQLFQNYLQLDIHQCSITELRRYICQNKWMELSQVENLDFDACLQLILSHLIEPRLGHAIPTFVYHFPSTQAALAKINASTKDSIPVAERFELYWQGIEIANGFHELTDPFEQKQRFQRDQQKRQQQEAITPEIDLRLLAALEYGIPACAGVALGVDRLVMLAAQAKSIDAVIAFPWERS